MKKRIFTTRSFLSLLVILALFAAVALTFTACDDDMKNEETQVSEIEFAVEVTKQDGTTKSFTVRSNKSNVGDALVEKGIISGEDGSYGWFITTVDGEYHKWEEDRKYWAFYINGEYAMNGVSSTSIVEGDTYSFKVE